MKQLVKEYNKKRAEMQGLESRRVELGKELSTFKTKLITVKNDLLTAEITELDLLRKTWSRRQVDEDIRQLEDGESARQTNDCNPVDFAGELDLLRARIDEALKGIYPDAAVEAVRASTEDLRRSTKTIETLIRKITGEIEDIDALMPEIKKMCMEAERKVWIANYEKLKKELRDAVFPKIRKAFITVNGLNPRFWRWGNPSFFYDLFPEVTIEEVLTEREEIRAEIFGEKP